MPEFLKKESISKIKENERVKTETKEVKADIKDLQKQEEQKNLEYLRKEKEIVTFLECKKTFMGRIKYFFKGKKGKKDEEVSGHSASKERLKDILSQDKENIEHFKDDELESKSYTVEDIIKIGKELDNNVKDNKNAKLDLKALQNKVDNIDKKLKNATEFLEEIDEHKKSIFEFWKYANKDESKMLAEGEVEEEETTSTGLRKTFDYEEDIENFASKIDSQQREKLTHKEQDALFASNFVLDGINIVSKEKLLKKNSKFIAAIKRRLQERY